MARLLVPQTGNGGFDSPQGHHNGPYCVGYRNYNGHNVATPGDRFSERGRSLVDPGVCQRREGKQRLPPVRTSPTQLLARLPPSRGWRPTLRTSRMEVRFLPVARRLSRAHARFPTRTSTADCSLDRRVMEVQILPGGPWPKPKPSRREAVNLVLVGASPIGHSNFFMPP